jgi:hypothetical protein
VGHLLILRGPAATPADAVELRANGGIAAPPLRNRPRARGTDADARRAEPA